jgi:hypothetical protein
MLALGNALLLHASSLDRYGFGGFAHLANSVQRRTYGELSAKKDTPTVFIIVRSLLVPGIIPWLNEAPGRFILETTITKLTNKPLKWAISNIRSSLSYEAMFSISVDVMSRVLFLSIVSLLFFVFFRERLAFVGISAFFLGSISWFIVAKGAATHWWFNYFQWYLLFLPVASLMLTQKFLSYISELSVRRGSLAWKLKNHEEAEKNN